MAFGATPVDVNQIPIGSVYSVPGAALLALQGGTSYTDASSNASAPGVVSVNDHWKPTYAVVTLGVSPVATPTDWITLQGSSTKTIRITRVVLNGIATSAGAMQVQLVKRTAANTAGTTTADTRGQFDSGDAAPTAVQARYTANATSLGAGVTLYGGHLMLPTAGSSIQNELEIDFGWLPEKCVVLRGTTQYFAINFNGVAVPTGASIDAVIVWTEE